MNQRDHEQEEEPLYEGDPDDDMFARRERNKHSSRVVSDFVRRAIENTVGQVQSSGALPKDAIEYLIKHGDRGRREIVRIVANEVGDFLKHTDISSEAIKVLTNLQIDFNASVRFKRNPDGKLSTEVADETAVSVSSAGPKPGAEGAPRAGKGPSEEGEP